VVDVADEYLCAAQAAGFAVVRLIHGRGQGVQRAAVQRLLRSHPCVESFWDAPETHLGATLVRLKPSASDHTASEPSS
jgi:DNA-nicking Smr family endonuclease